jgi:GNAT superfamily N-acetyltransferase
MNVVQYSESYRNALNQLMELLQNYEKTLSDDRALGFKVARDFFDYMLKECRDSNGEIYVAIEDSTVLGFVSVYIEREDDGDCHLLEEYKACGVIADLAVFEKYRNQGVAVALLEQAEHHCKTRKLNRVKISSLAQNHAAESLYRKFGFSDYEITYEKRI